MKTIAPYAEKVLNKQYKRAESKWDEHTPEYTIAEFCEMAADEDPNFYRWLFSDCDIDDYGDDLTDEELQIAKDFFELLQ